MKIKTKLMMSRETVLVVLLALMLASLSRSARSLRNLKTSLRGKAREDWTTVRQRQFCL